jgi:hypothetical protein
MPPIRAIDVIRGFSIAHINVRSMSHGFGTWRATHEAALAEDTRGYDGNKPKSRHAAKAWRLVWDFAGRFL